MAIFAMISTRADGAAGRSEYVFGVHFDSGAGISSAQYTDIGDIMLRIALKDYGYKWRIQRYASNEEIVDAFIKNQIDGAQLYPDQIVDMLTRGGHVHPLATYTIADKRMRSFCLWQARTNPISSSSQIVGSTILLDIWTPMSLVRLRNILLRQGIDQPLWMVFSSFTKIPGQNSAYMAVAMGKADFLIDSDDFDTLVKLLNPGVAGKMTHKFCSEPIQARAAIVLNDRTVPQKTINDFTTTVKNFTDNFDAVTKKDPQFRTLRTYAKMAKLKFVVAAPDEFKNEYDLYRSAKAKGWIKEADYILSIMKNEPPGKAVQIRPTFKMCKDGCAKNKKFTECVDRCMTGK